MSINSKTWKTGLIIRLIKYTKITIAPMRQCISILVGTLIDSLPFMSEPQEPVCICSRPHLSQ